MRIKKTYLVRKSLFRHIQHRNDLGHQLGFDYEDKLLENSISSYFFGEEKRVSIIKNIEELYVFMVDGVKNIKKTFHIAIEKNSRNIN